MARYVADTNILLRLTQPSGAQHAVIVSAMRVLLAQDVEFCYVPQCIGEFWNVSTRPRERNGFGLLVKGAEAHVQSIEQTMRLLPEDDRTYRAWRRLLLKHDVKGVQVHDAHLAAVLEVHGVTHLLTLNGSDFKRYPGLTTVNPKDVHI